MYRLVIVDDEDYILRQLSTLFHWEEMGFCVAGAFTSGEQCLRYAQSHPVDALLTDIRLGEMTGLELTAAVRALHPKLETVLISAYSEFEYAREALGLGVSDYLLKPIRFNDIDCCFTRLRQRMDARFEMEAEFIALQRSKLYSDILCGVIASREEAARSPEAEVWLQSPDGARFSLLTLEFPGQAFPNRHRTALRSLAKELCGASCVLLSEVRPGTLSALLIFDAATSADPPLKTLESRCREQFPFIMAASVTGLYDDVFALAADYRNILVQNLENQSMLRQLRTYMNSGESDSAGRFLSAYLECRHLDLAEAIAFSSQLLDGDRLNREDIQTIEDVVRAVCSAYDLRAAAETPEQRIEHAQRYIEDNLDADISLESVAQYCSLTPTYFSRFFKQVTGERFITYLVKRRIERAKLLLNDESVRIDDIPNRVGYYSRSYFYKIFAAETGMTLAEYRRRACGNKP